MLISRLVRAAGDRLLASFVPQLDASACTPPERECVNPSCAGVPKGALVRMKCRTCQYCPAKQCSGWFQGDPYECR